MTKDFFLVFFFFFFFGGGGGGEFAYNNSIYSMKSKTDDLAYNLWYSSKTNFLRHCFLH